MNEKYITPSYWFLFIVLPAIIVGGVVVALSMPVWALAVAIFILVIVGEHGLRKWATFLSKKKGGQ